MITLYNVISSDGYIARTDGNEDFIPDEVWNDFIELCQKYDTVIIGGYTYNAIQNYEPQEIKKFEDLKVKKIIVSREVDFKPKESYTSISSVHEASTLGTNILLCSGPSLNTAFLKEKLIDKIILNTLPVDIHNGIREFQIDPPELTLENEDIREGRILRTYKVTG